MRIFAAHEYFEDAIRDRRSRQKQVRLRHRRLDQRERLHVPSLNQTDASHDKNRLRLRTNLDLPIVLLVA